MATSARARARSTSQARPAAARSANKQRPPKRDNFKQATLFGEYWEQFPRGLLPWPLLRRLSVWLTDSARQRVAAHLPPHFYYGVDSAPSFTASAASRFDEQFLAKLEDYRLRDLVGLEMERLVRILMREKLSERDEHREEAILGTVRRLGEAYRVCLARWRMQQAREAFWACLDVVITQAQKAMHLLRMLAATQERLARETAQQQAAGGSQG